MPVYVYKCAKCGWAGDRQASIEEKDGQLCHNTHPKPTRKLCGSLLEREEISKTANMKLNWASWTLPSEE